jgi:hypothetical protein
MTGSLSQLSHRACGQDIDPNPADPEQEWLHPSDFGDHEAQRGETERKIAATDCGV